jgi:hypothetical protein
MLCSRAVALSNPGGLVFGNLRIDKTGGLRARAENFHQLGKVSVGLDSVVECAAANAKNSARFTNSNKSFLLHLLSFISAERFSARRDNKNSNSPLGAMANNYLPTLGANGEKLIFQQQRALFV